MKYIFDVLSLINHSCCANVRYDMTNNTGFGRTGRSIRKNGKISINFLGDDVTKTIDQRQQMLKKKFKFNLNSWNFECKCEKCVL